MFFSFVVFLFTPLARFFLHKLEGMENIPSRGPFIIAVNHASYADPVFLLVVLRQRLKKEFKSVYTIAKVKFIWKILFGLKISSRLFHLLMIDPKDRKKVLEEGEVILRNGGIVVVFVEGTRTRTGKMQEAKTGAARLALKTFAPVIPVGLSGTYKLWSRHMLLPRFKRIIEVRIGKKVELAEFYHKPIGEGLLKKATQKIADSIKKLIWYY
jgi:1-acyl-sn-glycerol-3-phosphate acyltransferase